MERWGVGEAGDPIYRAAAAILGMRARVTDCGEIPGRFLLRERRRETRPTDGAGRPEREAGAGAG